MSPDEPAGVTEVPPAIDADRLARYERRPQERHDLPRDFVLAAPAAERRRGEHGRLLRRRLPATGTIGPGAMTWTGCRRRPLEAERLAQGHDAALGDVVRQVAA